jgi:hypothetical protein
MCAKHLALKLSASIFFESPAENCPKSLALVQICGREFVYEKAGVENRFRSSKAEAGTVWAGGAPEANFRALNLSSRCFINEI